MKIRKHGRKIRRDLHYIDPVSGYVFNSMKDVLRYLKTGELGRLAFKPKDKGGSSMELEDDKGSLPSVAGGQKLAESGINGQVLRNQSFDGVVKEEQNLESTSTGDCIPQSEHTSDQGREGAAGSSVNLPKTNDLEQRGGKNDFTIGMPDSAHVVGPLQEKLPNGNEVGRQRNGNIQHGSNKRKNKREPNLPRRASKRIAGVELDPTPELKTNNRARRIATKESGEAEAKTDENLGNMTTPEEHSGKVEAENKADVKQECPLVLPPSNLDIQEENVGRVETVCKAEEKPELPPRNLDIQEENVGQVETGCKADEKPELPPRNLDIQEENVGQVETVCKAEEKPELPLGSSTKDSWRCIDFAIKTLTGAIPIEGENTADKNLGSMEDLWSDPCIEFAIKTLTGTIPMEDMNKAQENPGSSFDLPIGGELWTDPCIEFAIKTLMGTKPMEDENKVQENPGYSFGLPIGGKLWTDPCIEFAVKTLTGAIPVGNDDLCVRDYMQQRPCSSETRRSQNGNLDFSNTDLWCQQSTTEEKPLLKQQEQVKHPFPHTGNISLQNSDNDARRHVEVKSEKCPRQTML
ncbi:methyl-CpG-binding domain-containing protein 13-like isoform X2 [Cornus florida]|nr:methyl-CpG-binding domain-containing protein 13-like isoform X2 [Cornus florida]